METVFQRLQTSPDGLTDEEAAHRLAVFGENMIHEHKKNELLVFLGYSRTADHYFILFMANYCNRFYWNPLSWAMEAAAIIAITLLDYADFALIIFLLTLNATIGWWEDRSAGNAVAALKSQLENQSRVLRSGEFKSIPASLLVPGDVIRVRIGDIIPADIKLLHGESVKIDQAALTGESLPVTKSEFMYLFFFFRYLCIPFSSVAGDEAFAGSVVKQGEIEAIVHSTGQFTFFGKAASLLENANKRGHLQSVRKLYSKYPLNKTKQKTLVDHEQSRLCLLDLDHHLGDDRTHRPVWCRQLQEPPSKCVARRPNGRPCSQRRKTYKKNHLFFIHMISCSSTVPTIARTVRYDYRAFAPLNNFFLRWTGALSCASQLSRSRRRWYPHCHAHCALGYARDWCCAPFETACHRFSSDCR